MPEDLPTEQSWDNPAPSTGFDSWLLTDIERIHIMRCLEAHGNSIPKTAKALGISDKGLRNKLERY